MYAMLRSLALVLVLPAVAAAVAADETLGTPLPAVPDGARLAFEEDWSTGKLDPAKWYVPRKRWGNGNNGVTPDNVRLVREAVGDGKERFVLVCQANGDRYDGPVLGHSGKKARVGGMVVSKPFFASGRFEVVMRIGSTEPHDGGPADPRRPVGTIPAVWTYAYRYVTVPRRQMDQFVPDVPLYNPHMKAYGGGANEYWSELDFPEFGKGGELTKALYNTFLQNRHEPRTYDVGPMIDGRYHTLTTDWRTALVPLEGVTDAQVREAEGYFWVSEKSVRFERYFGNPLKRLGPDRYAVYVGERADHYLDGRKVAENTKYVPAMAAQLTMGVWLPDWAGPAPWGTATVSFASVKVWQYDDAGDVRGILTEDVKDNFGPGR